MSNLEGQYYERILALEQKREALESELAKAKEEIEWWKEKANGSLAMANEAMDQRDRYREALEKIESDYCGCDLRDPWMGCDCQKLRDKAKQALAGETEK